MMFIKKNINANNDFEVFFLRNYPKVKAFALKILMSEQDAEDVSQDVFIKLLDKPEIWQNEKAGNYLFTMTKNHIFNLIKRRNIERQYQQTLADKNMLASDFGLDDKLHAKEIELLIMYYVEQMPEQRKLIFKMSRYDGKNNTEISELLDISIRTVERHIYLALADLKKLLFSPEPD
jgi:RNA polymerase sigma-70 factor (ECF subfamily)